MAEMFGLEKSFKRIMEKFGLKKTFHRIVEIFGLEKMFYGIVELFGLEKTFHGIIQNVLEKPQDFLALPEAKFGINYWENCTNRQ